MHFLSRISAISGLLASVHLQTSLYQYMHQQCKNYLEKCFHITLCRNKINLIFVSYSDKESASRVITSEPFVSRWKTHTLNLQNGFSCVNSTGAMLLLKYPLPVPQKACSWFHFAKMASLSSPKSVGAERALAVLMSWFDWAGVWAGWLNKPPPNAAWDGETNELLHQQRRACLLIHAVCVSLALLLFTFSELK